jgi:hypothetical protein
MTIRANLTDTHQVLTKTPDGRDLVFLTGTGIVDFTGNTSDFIREELAIHLSPPDGPIWSVIEQCAPVVALAALWNGGPAQNAGWAVDWTNWTVYSWSGQGPHLLLASGIAVSDTDGILIRVSYQATALGRLG